PDQRRVELPRRRPSRHRVRAIRGARRGAVRVPVQPSARGGGAVRDPDLRRLRGCCDAGPLVRAGDVLGAGRDGRIGRAEEAAAERAACRCDVSGPLRPGPSPGRRLLDLDVSSESPEFYPATDYKCRAEKHDVPNPILGYTMHGPRNPVSDVEPSCQSYGCPRPIRQTLQSLETSIDCDPVRMRLDAFSHAPSLERFVCN